MRKNVISLLLTTLIVAASICGCGSASAATAEDEIVSTEQSENDTNYDNDPYILMQVKSF